MKQILLVSNDTIGNEDFVSELRKKYEVDDVGYIQTALYKLRHPESFGLIIIEVGMPPYNLYSLKETEDGHKTGIIFYEQAVKQLSIPVIFWSWSDEFRDEISELDGCDIIFVKKELDENHLLIAATEFVGDL